MKQPCHLTRDHPAHLWIRCRQWMECPGVGGDTGIVLVDTNDEALVERLAQAMHDGLSEAPNDWPLEEVAVRAVLAALREQS